MVFAGLTSVIAKLGMKNLNSDVALSIRTAVVLCLIVAYRRLGQPTFLRSNTRLPK